MSTYKQYEDKSIVINDKIVFEENKPFSVKIEYIKRYPIHMHEDVTEILLSLKGSMNVITSHENVYVKEGDFVFVNSNSIHSIQSSDEAIVAVFHIDLNFFEKKNEYIKYMYFRNNMYSKKYKKIESDNFDYQRIESKTMFKNKLIGILLNTVYKFELSDEISLLYEDQIIESMINEFNWLQFLNKDNIKPNQLDRYYRIVKYIQEHINERITLDDIASIEYISKNYFSHFWKNISNFSFIERVNFEKVFKSEYMLLTTDINIVSIAEKFGFSDVKYYYNHFKRWYGTTPLVHRNSCNKYMNLKMKHFILPAKEATKIVEDYLKYYYESSFTNFRISANDSYPLIKQLFVLDENYFTKNNMSIVLDLFKLVNIENSTIKINSYIIYQIILLTNAKNLGLTVKIDCNSINNDYFFDILNNFFRFSLFHFGRNITEKWDYFIKYNENVSLEQINKIKKIVQNNVKNATFKYYLEI